MDEDIERIDILLRANGYICSSDKSTSYTYSTYKIGNCTCESGYIRNNDCNCASLYLRYYTLPVCDVEVTFIDHIFGAKIEFFNTKKLLDYLINKYAMQKLVNPDND